jgi:hypothetical protein
MKIGQKAFFTEKNYCTFGTIKGMFTSDVSPEFDLVYLKCNGVTGFLLSGAKVTETSSKIVLKSEINLIN